MSDTVIQPLYEAHEKIYPRQAHGRFARLRIISLLSLLGIFYLTPLIQWNGHQAVLFDLPARKFYLFNLTLWPQDFFYLAALLILAGLTLFFFTALAGRIWCGYACPQTVWTEAFIWMERKIEGNHMQQRKRDQAAWTVDKFRVKFLKHSAWILFSLWTGFTFVGYFTPMETLVRELVNFEIGPWEGFWIIFYGFATYGNAGWMREQVCKYMCPYARFQSAMFDKDTLIIAYDTDRGDPRGARSRKIDKQSSGLGDCIDCKICVQVCPTGIDIRNGLQYECIACSACIDACDDVMDKMNYARGLIRYTTESTTSGNKLRLMRPRIIVYALLLLVAIGTLAFNMSQRVALEIDVIRDRNSLFRETREGLIENVYILKIINMDNSPHQYSLWVEGIEGLSWQTDEPVIVAAGNSVSELVVRLQADEINLKRRSTRVEFHLRADDANHLYRVEEARFLGPRP